MDPEYTATASRSCAFAPGKFERDMWVTHARTGKEVKPSQTLTSCSGKNAKIVNDAYAGDVVGLVGHDEFLIGDTLTAEPNIVYNEIPRFPPECFAFIHNPTPAKFKSFRKGLDQLLTEGVVQAFTLKNSPRQAPCPLPSDNCNLEVVQYRLESEYGAEARIEKTAWQLLRWLDPGVSDDKISEIRLPPGAAWAEDIQGRTVVLFDAPWALNYFLQNQKNVALHEFAPGAVTLSSN